MGWPEPIAADSGNGAHLLYRIDLPNDSESAQLIKQALTVLSTFFSDEKSGVDTSVAKAAQLWKLYGTMAKKGDSVADRPHRRSLILSSPEYPEVVSRELLIQLASLLPSPPEPAKPINRKQTDILDLGIWLNTYGLSYREKPYGGGRLFLFDQCPFSSAHADGAYAIQFDNGAIFAGCHHNSCGGGEQRWSELREQYEGPRPKRNYENRMKQQVREKAQAKAEYYGNIPDTCSSESYSADIPLNKTEPDSKPESHSSTSDIPEQARDILHHGDPVAYIKNSIAVDHEGDDVVASCLIMSFASRSVLNSNGLHVLVTGESGKGKSHIFDTMIQHVPPEQRLDGRLSDKALYYTEGLKPGTAICLDDVTLSEGMQETLKGVTTSFKKPFIYRTVNKDRKGQVCTIPERCIWWVAKVEGTGDDQVWNRMLTCWIDDSAEQDEKVLARELAAAEEFPEVFTEIREEVLVSHEIWKQVVPVHVVIPYAKRIRFTSSTNRRNPGMLLDLIKSHAALFQYQRQKVRRDNVDVIIASEEDFDFASQIYQALNGESGSQSSKLTRQEAILAARIHKTGGTEFTMEELINLTGKSYDAIRKNLHGGTSHKVHYDGLLVKCPAISYLFRTDSTGDGTVSKRQQVYLWNRRHYEIWMSGGGCWLDIESGDEDPDGGNGGCRRKDSGSVPLSDGMQESDVIQKEENNNIINTSWRKEEQVQRRAEPVDDSHSEPGTIRRSATTDEQIDTTAILAPVREMEKETNGGENPQPSAKAPSFPPTLIDPDDYGPINGVWGGPCAVCGGKWVQYTEKFSQKMKAEDRFSYKICQKCYDRAVARKSKTFTALPGLVHTAHMVRANTDIGRCEVCNTGPAVWIDPNTKQKICQVCYAREQDTAEGLS